MSNSTNSSKLSKSSSSSMSASGNKKTTTKSAAVTVNDDDAASANKVIQINSSQLVDTSKASFQMATPQTLFMIKNRLVRELTRAIQLVNIKATLYSTLLFAL